MTHRTTALHPQHLALKARMVDFAGWDMPVYYQSQIEEHHAVRKAAGMFDVSHMRACDITGRDALAFLRQVLANDVAKLPVHKALYSCLLHDNGGIVDDLIAYSRGNGYRLVLNAGCADKDLAHLQAQTTGFDVTLTPREDLSILAVAGPQARAKVEACLPPALAAQAAGLKAFMCAEAGNTFVATTGYTGEAGYEIIAPHTALLTLWVALIAQGVTPCGLGARDTLRLEAGMNLYGNDMDERYNPYDCGLAWTLDFNDANRHFTGRAALTDAPKPWCWVGVVLNGRGVLRSHLTIRIADDAGGYQYGETTSGTFSPTLQKAIALARVPAGEGADCEVEIRGQWHTARLVPPVFVRNGVIKI